MSDVRVTLIVDGYNVIFRLFPEAGTGAEPIRDARRRLEGELARLATLESMDVWVDYDGAEVAGVLPEMTTDPAISVRYTEPPAEADDAIVQRARQFLHEGRRSVTVFSDDRELSRRVREVGASVENVDALALRLQRLRARTRSPVDPPPEVPEEEARLQAIHERQERISAHAAEQDRQRELAATDDTRDGRREPAAADDTSDKRAVSEEERRRLRGRRRQARRLGQAGGAGTGRGKRDKKKKKGRG